ncbi:MAG TPA: hypothetical protein VLA84_04015 [Microcoleus sp.]|nr:hypothetical protein [Microcoleus sp.]
MSALLFAGFTYHASVAWQATVALSIAVFPQELIIIKIVMLHLSKDRLLERHCTQPAEIPLN